MCRSGAPDARHFVSPFLDMTPVSSVLWPLNAGAAEWYSRAPRPPVPGEVSEIEGRVLVLPGFLEPVVSEGLVVEGRDLFVAG